MKKSNGLEKLVYIYSVDTSSFYNEIEQKLHKKLLKAYRYRDYLKPLEGDISTHKKFVSKRISVLKDKLYEAFNKHEGTRSLRLDSMRESNVISIFDSVLTRTLGLKENTLSQDILVVQSYYFQILEDVIKNGFNHNGEKYIYFTSSAGQIRTKKSVFIKESIWNKYQNTLTCGLSVAEINRQGGSNTNKFLAYLALTNSASSEWKGFNINRAIVVEDMETNVFSEVDYIDHQSYKIKRTQMGIPITHTDGCGMILPRKSKKSFMVRLPWIKGLLVPFPFDKFAKENDSYKVTDIYGKEWDIVNDGIEVIFTKSQFKMWKYYQGWEEYKNQFILHKCEAAKLNEEDTTGEAKLNYQMLQTLTDITNDELKVISADTVEDIFNIGSDKETMLRVLGATEMNSKKNNLQQALLMYPELLNDVHSKEVIKDKKKSMVKDARSGKLNVEKAKYTFIIPDLFAYCEWLFLGVKEPKGLLNNGEVYCNLYENGKVDILRSPHLYREHAVKNNVLGIDKSKWFITTGIYTSVHDPISKMLQFDNDGDKVIVIQNKTIVDIAERNMQGIVPLYYEMAVANKQEISNDNIYHSLIMAYKANIGEISNNITKIWNSHNVDLDVIKWLTMENNFTIDFAKTLYMPTRPDNVNIIISQYIKAKVPHFFINAKDKELGKVEVINNSVVNRLEGIIPNKRINFVSVAGKFDYKMLMKRKNVKLDQEIIDTYTKLDRNKKWMMKQHEDLSSNDKLYIYKFIREELLKVNADETYITDVLVKYLYSKKNSKHKTTLWESFGDIIVKNLSRNIKDTKQCGDCGIRVDKTSAKKYCSDCATKREKERLKNRSKKGAEIKTV